MPEEIHTTSPFSMVASTTFARETVSWNCECEVLGAFTDMNQYKNWMTAAFRSSMPCLIRAAHPSVPFGCQTWLMALHVLACNMKKAMRILGVGGLMEAIRS
jgi:hypothetical protein